MRWKGIFIFELICSNEMFISSNKNQHDFLKFNEVKYDVLVLFRTFHIICGNFFLMFSTVESMFCLAMESR